MGFWLSMFVVLLLISATMIGIGWFFMKYPPKTINLVFGYLTKCL